ncbi:MAG: hypothetical protein WBM14_19460 [Terracidiphilus sp.]
MNTIYGTALGLMLATGGCFCTAQEALIPLEQLPQAPQQQTRLALPSEELAMTAASRALPAFSYSASFEPARPVAPRIVDGKFLTINGLHLGMAVFDVEMTQRCIASHKCREGNPLMPSSQAGQLAVDFAYVAYGTGLSHWLRKHKSRLWWLPPTTGIVAHTVGAATGLLHQ